MLRKEGNDVSVLIGSDKVNKVKKIKDSVVKRGSNSLNFKIRAVSVDELKRLIEGEKGFFSSLSGGQKQRVLIARALTTDPKILILDEPTASIDAQTGLSIYELLTELNNDKTIIMVSHDVGAISRSVKKIACMNKKLVYHNTKEITKEMLEETYQCPVDLIAHGVPHRVLDHHHH